MNRNLKLGKTFLSSLIFPLSMMLMVAGVSTEAAPIQPQATPMTQLDLETKFPQHMSKLLGFSDVGHAVVVAQEHNNPNSGFILNWDVHKAKQSSILTPSKWIFGYFAALSDGGKYLVTDNPHSVRYFPDAKGYRITGIKTGDLRTQWTRNLKSNENSGTFLAINGDGKHVLSVITSMIPYKGETYFGPRQFEITDAATGRVSRTLSYEHAGGCTGATLSPNQKYLACSFTRGEDDVPDEQLDRKGVVDVLDYKSGKILWHLAGTDKQPVGDPFFFISPTRFISSDTVFNIQTRKARHWNAITPTRKCLAAVPNHSNFALFLTPGGLQLRNWQKDKLLVSWPNVKKPGRILFSPDLKMFSFKRGSLIQFWKFDPKWLK